MQQLLTQGGHVEETSMADGEIEFGRIGASNRFNDNYFCLSQHADSSD